MKLDPEKLPTKPSTSLPATAEPELVSPNDVALTYQKPNFFDGVFPRQVLTPEELAFNDACSTAKAQKQIIERYIGWKVRLQEIGQTQRNRSGEEHAPQQWNLACDRLRAERQRLNSWQADAVKAGVNVADVLAQVYPPVDASGSDAEIQRLTRVFIGLETPRQLDSFYIEL